MHCYSLGENHNDIHIALAKKPDTGMCKSVTAEMPPHFRPKDWTADAVSAVGEHPVKITGQLFFDGSHRPCKPGKKISPKRASVWKIHPVYKLEVCKNESLGGCKVDDPSVWSPLEPVEVDEDED